MRKAPLESNLVPHALITSPCAAAHLDRATGWPHRHNPSERTRVIAASVDAASKLARSALGPYEELRTGKIKRRDLDQRRRLEQLRRLA